MDNSNFNRRIIVDLDDTLAFHSGKDFKNAEPNKPLIRKLNELYNSGFEIMICTARGSLSCNSRKEADEKYRNQILQWLHNHDVLFHSLSFNKELGIAYIDDKAYTPNEFTNTEYEILNGGYSGLPVVRLGNSVIKTDTNAKMSADWMKYAGYTTPVVTSVINNTIVMGYVNGIPMAMSMNLGDDNRSVIFNKVIETIVVNYETDNILASMGLINDQPLKYSYVNRIINHWQNAYNDGNKTDQELLNNMKFVNDVVSSAISKLRFSNYHGDMSCMNIIIDNNNEPVFIDPIIVPDLWYSSILDAAKLAASFLLYSRIDLTGGIYNEIKCVTDLKFNEFKLLIACELIRTYKYRKSQAEKNYIFDLVKDKFIEGYSNDQ